MQILEKKRYKKNAFFLAFFIFLFSSNNQLVSGLKKRQVQLIDYV
jgi:hypothetical protein